MFTFPLDSLCELDVFRHDGDTMNPQRVQQGMPQRLTVMPPMLKIENASLLCGTVQFPSLSAEWYFVKQKFCAFFILTNFVEGNSTRMIVMKLLDSAASRGTLTSRFGCKCFLGSFASSGFASSLLGASHSVR